jgi:peptide chain release factor 2
MSKPDFWGNPEASQKTIAALKAAKDTVDTYAEIERGLSDQSVLLDCAEPGKDDATLAEAAAALAGLRRKLEHFELRSLFNRENDGRDVFFSIHAGAGGTDSCDWAGMLLRMYTRWLERSGYASTILDLLEGEEAGVKRAVLHVRGSYPFGNLKSEIGVHRLVRISPFDANKRRHTSFASVDVVPEHEETDLVIEEKDLRIDTYSAGGPGGQHENKTQSAIRLVHLPTGIVAACQNERSQHMNKKMAMKILIGKILQQQEAAREQELQKMFGEKGEIAFGYQIRSYVLHPYTLCKDHRTEVETGNVQAVLDGELDPFIEGFLKWKGRKY